MADVSKVKRNVAKMVSMGAPEEEIDAYIAGEGVTLDEVRAAPTVKTEPPKKPETPMPTAGQRAGAAVLGATDMLTFGLADEASGGLAYLLDKLPGGKGRTYDELKANVRGIQSAAQEASPSSYLVGQLGGGAGGGLGLARAGLSAGANAIRSGQGLGRVALGSSVDAGVLGAAHGAGSGEGLEDRARRAATGLVVGATTGAAVPLASAGVAGVAQPLVAPIMSRLRPDRYADQAMAEALQRSGRTPAEIEAAIRQAHADRQGVFNVADAMGHSGQRMLSTVARTPNNARQGVIDTLTQRQAGQGERLTNALAEGFDAPDTAAARAARLTAERSAAADANYGAARADAYNVNPAQAGNPGQQMQAAVARALGGPTSGAGRPVNPSAAIRAADVFLRPGATGIMRNQSGIADDSIEAAVTKARSYLTDGRNTLTDFDASLRAKQELDAMIERAQPKVQRYLIPIRNALDDALVDASPSYRQARDTFRRQSQGIDAVAEGTAAASPRRRAADTIPAFRQMTPDQRYGYRGGYVDPWIAKVEAASSSPTTNKARMLMTDKTRQEFPEFAAPGRGPQMGRRIGREQRMFETANAAMGGSKTADNLADATEMSRFDPGVMAALFQGRPVQAAVAAATRLLTEAQGMPPSVVERVARTLMETRPDVVRALLAQATRRGAERSGARAAANAMLIGLSGSGAGRAATP